MGKIHRGKNLASAIVLFLSIVITSAVCGQKLDSLQSLLREHPFDDTTRVLLLSQVAGYYQVSAPDSTMFFATKGVELAQKIKYSKGIAICKTLLGTSLIVENRYDKGLELYNEALNVYIKEKNLAGEAVGYHNLGNAYYSIAKFDLAIDNYNKSREISIRINDIKDEGLELMSVGNVYKELGDYTPAIQYYLNSLKLLEKVNDTKDIANTMTNIASVYSLMGDYKMALQYINKSLVLDSVMHDSYGRLYNIVNIGVIDGEIKDYQGAIVEFRRALLAADSLNDNFWRTTCNANIGEAYYYLGDYDESFRISVRTIEMAKKIGEYNTVASSESVIGNIYIKKGSIAEGINHLKTAYGLVQKSGLKDQMYQISHDLSDAYEKAHDYAHALEYHKIYFDLRDTMYNEKNQKKVQQLQFDYELGKKESQITLLEKDKLIEQNRIMKQRVSLWALVSGVVLLAFIVFILYRSRTQLKRSKDNILRQKEEIQQQAKKLEELNRFKDKTFSVLSHDLRGPLNAIAATIGMLDENLISPEEFASLKPEVNDQLASLNNLVENLLNWAKTYIKGQTNAIPEMVPLLQVTRQITKFVQGVADKKGILIVNNIAESVGAYCDPVQLEIVIRNLLMNALKFTRGGGKITLSAIVAAGKVKIAIADTGVGMTPEQLKKLFMPVAGNSTYGTAGETGTGLGLLLCYEFMKANNGNITIDSEVGKGSTFVIELPASGNSLSNL